MIRELKEEIEKLRTGGGGGGGDSGGADTSALVAQQKALEDQIEAERREFAEKLAA